MSAGASPADSQSHERNIPFGVAAVLDLAHASPKGPPPVHPWLPSLFFRKPQVFKMLESAGFQVVSCETIGKLFCVEARPR